MTVVILKLSKGKYLKYIFNDSYFHETLQATQLSQLDFLCEMFQMLYYRGDPATESIELDLNELGDANKELRLNLDY